MATKRILSEAGESDHVIITVRLPKPLILDVDQLARATRRSRNGMIDYIIENAVREFRALAVLPKLE